MQAAPAVEHGAAADLAGIEIDQVVIGSCTNGRLEDLHQAASMLRGRKVHPRVRVIILPGTQQVCLDATADGTMQALIEAGGAFSTPTCGACLGGHMGVLAAGERAVATTNRNFVGRMGHPGSEVYLASPYVAAASAIAGHVATPDMVGAGKGGRDDLRRHRAQVRPRRRHRRHHPGPLPQHQRPGRAGPHCMEDIDAGFVDRVQPGDIIVADENFGCGSSREHAPVAIKASGVSVVVAASFARIFYRNAINTGLPIVVCPEAAHDARRRATACGSTWPPARSRTSRRARRTQADAFPPFMQELIGAGGLLPYVKARLGGGGRS